MQKIISLFKRDYEGTRQVYNEVVPGAEWVLAGEGRPTIKWDGTSCMIRDGAIYKRYDAKHGKTPPTGFIPAQEPDPTTGHWPGWIQCSRNNPQDKWHFEAFDVFPFADGTYELCGPKVNGNPHRFTQHTLIPHGVDMLFDVPRDFDGIREYLTNDATLEGIVWHHDDGRLVKIKRKDFGLQWPPKKEVSNE